MAMLLWLPSGDYIRAKSLYYNEPSFSDVSVNMSGEEVGEYNTDEDAYFGKACIWKFYITVTRY